ncbi:MAG: hypothetical protein FD170_1151 [Bacteroidetes bacterium]|nr:MAG: hypothetical protein FD170_1151 [Bacteroidota bacterium]
MNMIYNILRKAYKIRYQINWVNSKKQKLQSDGLAV